MALRSSEDINKSILIIGCGKVGSSLASQLDKLGYAVSVVDSDASHFHNLPSDFSGLTVTGIPIDIDVLEKAGIQECDAVAAVSQDDNVNIMVSQLAKKKFNIQKVVARVYEPRRKEVFEEFGLQTICLTDTITAAVLDTIQQKGEKGAPIKYFHLPANIIRFEKLAGDMLPKEWVGKSVSDIAGTLPDDLMIFGIYIKGTKLVLNTDPSLVINADDSVIVSSVLS